MASDTRRLFFALWPPARVADAIAAQAAACGVDGRPVPPGRIHLTLVFLGDVGGPASERLLAGAGGIALPGFDLVLSRAGHFRGPGVAWLGPAAAPAALLDLVAAVQDVVAAAGIEPGSRPFRPHVTVARRARPPRRIRPPAPVTWPVAAFGLTESARVDGRAVYRDIGRWSLAPASME